MMISKIKIRPKALKFIEKQDKLKRIRIYKAIYNLPNGDVKKMVGCKIEDKPISKNFFIFIKL